MSERQKRAAEWLVSVAERMQEEKDAGNLPTAETLTIRELVDKFGYMRRSRIVVGEIRKGLEDNELSITPKSFDNDNPDNEVEITLNERASIPDDERTDSLTVRIGHLDAAHNRPISIKPDHPLAKATTIMQSWNYSQLPVMINDRVVKGVISWRSIGEAYAHGRDPKTIGDCMEKARIVNITMTLSDATNEIYKHDYILVRGEEEKVTGIVTASDIAYQFKQLSHPFLLVREIESHLCNIMRGKFTKKEINNHSQIEREILGPNELTFGGYIRLLGYEENWNRLGLKFDRREFILQLEEVRKIRNEIMHFSVNELRVEKIMQLERVVSLLRKWRANTG